MDISAMLCLTPEACMNAVKKNLHVGDKVIIPKSMNQPLQDEECRAELARFYPHFVVFKKRRGCDICLPYIDCLSLHVYEAAPEVRDENNMAEQDLAAAVNG